MLAALARLLAHSFFRRIEIVGRESVPESGPLILAANHCNSLIDPLLLLAASPRSPRFLAKSTLWEQPFLRPLLEAARAIPVYRRQDAGVDTTRNRETFEECWRALAEGGVVALFPEGTSHSAPRLEPLRTGVARIALGALAAGSEELRIVPVGLNFADKSRFRSDVLIRFGEALAPVAPPRESGADDVATVRELTAAIAEGLGTVTLQHESWDEARLLSQAVSVVAGSPETSLSRRFERQQAAGRIYRRLVERRPAAAAAMAVRVRAYRRQLGLLSLRDGLFEAPLSRRRQLVRLLRNVGLLVLVLPLAVFGVLVSYPAYWLTGRLARRGGRPEDRLSTYKLSFAVALYPLAWLLVAVLAYWLGGLWWGLSALALGPVSGYAALRFDEERGELFALLRGGVLALSPDRRLREIGRRRSQLRSDILSLLDDEGIPYQDAAR